MSHSETAEKLVLGDRNADYGPPKQDFECQAMVWSGLMMRKLKEPLTAVDVGLMMVGMKLCRHAHKPKDDNLVDGHGYFDCIEWIETGVKPSNQQVERLLLQVEQLRQTIEDLACGAGLECPKCRRQKPCDCEHQKPENKG